VIDARQPKSRNWSVARPLYNGPKRSNGTVPVPWPSAVSRVPRLPPTGSYAGFPSGGAAAGAVAGQAGPPSSHLGGPIYDSAGPVLGAAGAAPAGMRGGGFSGAGPSHFGAPPGFRPTLGPGLPPPPRGMLGGGSAGPRPSTLVLPPTSVQSSVWVLLLLSGCTVRRVHLGLDPRSSAVLSVSAHQYPVLECHCRE
jgi:hypothetical protein